MNLIPGFSFASPWVLCLLLLIPPLAFLRGKFGGTAGVSFSSTASLLQLGHRRRSRAGAFLAALSYLALAALIVALARPQFGREISRVQASGVDIMLELDVSGSMANRSGPRSERHSRPTRHRALIEALVTIARESGREIANVHEARAAMGLRPAG